MALSASLAALCCAAIFGLACAALGHLILARARLAQENELEHLLCSGAVGVICYEAIVALGEFVAPPRTAVVVALALLLGGGVLGMRGVWRSVAAIFGRITAGSRSEHGLAVAAGLVLLFEGLAAMAPLTGSDALHYHFTAPLLTLRNGFAPNFNLVNSFFTGQGHLLILTGLALGSEKLSLALIFLGGVLAAAAGACLARKLVSREWAWLCALSFLLTPVVFWQISTAGAPDIWMAFFAVTGVLVAARARTVQGMPLVLLAGALDGALAGAKYTGCLFAAALLLAFAWEARSLRRVAVFVFAALVAGVWPYARNALWTGDPVFPFLTRWVAPAHTNLFTLESVRAASGASGHHSLLQLLEFPFLVPLDQSHAGFWQFLGPLPLIFVPLMWRAARKNALWRVALLMWLVSGVLVGASSGMLRFLLPVLPVALALAFAAVCALRNTDWRFARALALASIAAFLVLCCGGLFVYGRPAVAAAIGLVSRNDYLRQRAPDYGKVEFINQTLPSEPGAGKALVFMRHLYYLRVPYLPADPDNNWNIDPSRFQSSQSWRELFHANDVRWVVRSPEYPQSIAAPLQQLESEGALVPIARGEINDFEGMRLFGTRKTVPIVIFRVAN